MTTYVRKDRTVDGALRHGPTHVLRDGLTLCGRRMKGLAHHTTARPDESLLCDLCLAHDRRGTRQPYTRR